MTEPAQPFDTVPDDAEIEQLQKELQVSGRELAEAATERAIAAIAVHNAMMKASIGMTYPRDWVRMGNAEKGLYFLQEKGCARVAKLWGIRFEKIDLERDVVRELVGDDDVQFTVAMTATCERTGRTETDLSEASSADGFFAKGWAKARDKAVERKMLENEIRKAAITHCRGRLIRVLTGLNGMPREVLDEHGIDVAKCEVADFQSGGQGGSGDGPSDAQIRKLASEAAKKIPDLAFDEARELIEKAHLTKREASAIIDMLVKAKKATLRGFCERLDVDVPAAPPPPNAEPPAGDGASAGPRQNLAGAGADCDLAFDDQPGEGCKQREAHRGG